MDRVKHNQAGFTLVETSIALVVLMVAALAMASLFVYSLQNNVGGSARAQAMAVAQQQLEQLRSVDFADSTLNTGTTNLSITSGGHDYKVVRTISDETNSDATLKSLRKISITVTPSNPGQPWQRSSVTLVSHRSSTAIGNYAQ